MKIRTLIILMITGLFLGTGYQQAMASDSMPPAEKAVEKVAEIAKAIPAKQVTSTKQHEYDKAALKKSVDEAEADKDGIKTAEVYGKVITNYSDGVTQTQDALFQMTLKDGKYSTSASIVSSDLFTVNNVWMMVCTFLVFIMHLGFSCLEIGLTRAKNTVNILFKNMSIVAIGLLTYTLCGFNLMYPGTNPGGWFGFAGFGISAVGSADETMAYASGAYTYWTDFLFQGMFAATAATIVSGAVAERIKLNSFLIFSTIFVGIFYPIAGMWKWGGGALDAAGFYDFAGSTLVHSVGGWAALAGILLLGPRIGKYKDGKTIAIMGHSMPLATIGVFLLWLGWFGFNGGSVLSAAAGDTSRVLVTTCLAAAAGVIGAMIVSWIISKKPDLSMILNGSLAGLVGITAGADQFSITASIIIGAIAGVLVVLSVMMFDKLKIDDPVGALSVHLVCGIWGTLAVALFSKAATIRAQLYGIGIYGVFAFTSAFIIFFILKMVMGLRVSENEELRGLDIGEHGMEAYSGFQIFNNK